MIRRRRPSISYIRFILIFLLSWENLAQSSANLSENIDQVNRDIATSSIPNAIVSVPLFASRFSHHVYVYIGYPPQRRLVITDTGSRLLSFPCDPCQKCGTTHVSPSYWDPKISSTEIENTCQEKKECTFEDDSRTCEQNQCVVRQAYGEGSTTTVHEMEDIVWIGTDHIRQSIGVHMHTAVPFTFGCETEETGMIKEQHADGIFGLSPFHGNLINVMYDEGSIDYNAFSLCLNRIGGTMSIGGTDMVHQHYEKMHIENMGHHTYYYAVEVQSIRLNNTTLPINPIYFSAGKGTIIDSGTSDTYLPQSIYYDFERIWEMESSGLGKHHNKRQPLTFEEFNKLPDIIITLRGGYDWVIHPKAYMEESESLGIYKHDLEEEWTGTKLFTNRIYVDEPEGCVLGANAMYGHDILFDMQTKTIGIAEADCTYSNPSIQ